MTPAVAPTGPGPHPPRLIVPVTEVRRHLGSRLAIRRELVADHLALSDARVPDGAEVSFTGEVESIPEGVVLTGVVSAPWTGTCRRCLREVEGVATVDIREIYEVKPVDGETWPLEHDQIDLGPLLHDTALLALPLAPLCADDCQGPAPDLFPARVEPDEAVDSEAPPPKDPRWAALEDLDL